MCHLFYPGLSIEPLRDYDGKPCLLLYNHQTAFDQFFISLMKKEPVYHVASEDILSNGWISRLLNWLVAPIPIRKQTSDMKAVKLCVGVAREGGTIAMAPEGNRTYDGRTVYINPAVVKLAKLIRLPLVLVRIEGGYGAHPRWSDVRRKGKLTVRVSSVISPEELRKADNDELYERVCKELYEDESGAYGTYRSRKSAEYLERIFYVCPKCGFSRFESGGRKIRCAKCGMTAEYTEEMRLQDAGGDFPYRSIGEWYDAQQGFVRVYDPAAYLDRPVYTDTAKVMRVRLYDRKEHIDHAGGISLFGDRIEIRAGSGEPLMTLPFEETGTVTVLGRNKLNIYCRGEVIQLKGERTFNALRYMNLFYRWKNIAGGRDDDEFLGL